MHLENENRNLKKLIKSKTYAASIIIFQAQEVISSKT